MSFDPFLTLGTVRFKRFFKKVRSQSPTDYYSSLGLRVMKTSMIKINKTRPLTDGDAMEVDNNIYGIIANSPVITRLSL